MLTRLLLALTLTLTGFATLAPAQAPDASKSAGASTITATGTARVERAPDYVDIMVGKRVEEKTAAEAQAAASKAIESTLAALRALKLDGEELQSGSIDLWPRFEHDNTGDRIERIVAYTASMTLRIRTTDLKAAAKIIDTALAAGCNRIDYVQFGIKEALAAREEAITLATKAARRKAEVLAAALDMRLTRVSDANTTSHQGGGWNPYGAANRMAQLSSSMEAPSGGGDDGGPVVPGKVEVWADTTVKFEAAPK
jgi:uncharacterized protein YggE